MPEQDNKTDDEVRREKMIADLTLLKDDDGWKVVVLSMQADVRQIERKLHGEVSLEDGETIESLQDLRNVYIGLVDSPENLIEQFGKATAIPIDLDPYSKEGMEEPEK